MTLDNQKNRDWAYSQFPGLINDPHFKITSPIDKTYNCIAWANSRDDIWWWPFPLLDGVYEWPIKEYATNYTTLIKLFESKGFTLCDNYEFDKKFVKVALYVDENENFTHAARQARDGFWKSKLGQAFDIIHGTPHTIENATYGVAKIFMCAKF